MFSFLRASHHTLVHKNAFLPLEVGVCILTKDQNCEKKGTYKGDKIYFWSKKIEKKGGKKNVGDQSSRKT